MSLKQLILSLKPKVVLLLMLTLGLAPFTPEPHIWGKLKWIAGGASGMKMMDYLDVLLHGLPWLLGIVYFGLKLVGKYQSQS